MCQDSTKRTETSDQEPSTSLKNQCAQIIPAIAFHPCFLWTFDLGAERQKKKGRLTLFKYILGMLLQYYTIDNKIKSLNHVKSFCLSRQTPCEEFSPLPWSADRPHHVPVHRRQATPCIPSSRIIVLASIWPLTSPFFSVESAWGHGVRGSVIVGRGGEERGVDKRKGRCR